MLDKNSDFAPDKRRAISKKRIFALGGITLTVSLLSVLFLDQTLIQMVTTKKHMSLYRIVRFLTDLGEGKYYFFFVLGTGVSTWISIQYFQKMKKIRHLFFEKLNQWAIYAFFCMLGSGILLQILKHLIGRQRPHVTPGVDPHTFDFFTLKWHYHSMPSGHAQTLFTFTTILWITFPKLPTWIFFVPATLALTRLPLEEHFLSDVLLGSYVGFAMTIFVSARLKKIIWQNG